MKIKLSDQFGEPDVLLNGLRRVSPSMTTGLVPGYYAGTYRDAVKGVGMDSAQLHTSYAERRFEYSLAQLKLSVFAKRSAVFLVHAPATANHLFSSEDAFRKLATALPVLSGSQVQASRGIVLPVFAITRGKSYTARMDNLGVRYHIEDPGYDPTEVAIEEGRRLGTLTVVIEMNDAHEQIKELIGQIYAGNKPTRAVL